MKTTIARQKDHETGGVQITITLNPADLEGLIDYRITYPVLELVMHRKPSGDYINPDAMIPVQVPLESEFAQLLAQVIVAECVASELLPRLSTPLPLTPERKRSTTRR